MSTTDILILVGLLAFVILGIRDGFLRKTFGIMGFIIGLICATRFMTPVSDLLAEWLGFSAETALVFAFFAIFVAIVVAVNLFYRWFGQSKSDTIKIVSRISGGILGGIQGVVAVSIILVMFSFIDMPSEEEKQESVFYEDIVYVAPRIFDMTTNLFPDSKHFFDLVKDKLGKVKHP
jgi:uncharacterized membrane protein required for colicin V production